MTAKSVQQALRAIATPERAKSTATFFKSGKGQYGEGDVFIGVTVPQSRIIAKQFKDLAMSEIETLLYSRMHEDRLVALHILGLQCADANEKGRKQIYTFYIKHRVRVNNWDLVDTSASNIVGGYLHYKDRVPLYKLSRSNNLWDRRIAIVATHFFILHNDFADTYAIAEILLHDRQDLIHKAVGWMLREAGKRNKLLLLAFLTTHAPAMPRTTLRYAIEHFSPEERHHYMNKKRPIEIV